MKLFQNEPKFYKSVFALALPIALQSLISSGVNMLDTIMVGSLGENALSATSLANSFISIYGAAHYPAPSPPGADASYIP